MGRPSNEGTGPARGHLWSLSLSLPWLCTCWRTPGPSRVPTRSVTRYTRGARASPRGSSPCTPATPSCPGRPLWWKLLGGETLMPGMQGGRDHAEYRRMRPAPRLPRGSSSRGLTLLPGLPQALLQRRHHRVGPDDDRVIESSESFPLFSDPTAAPHSPPFLFLHPDNHPRLPQSPPKTPERPLPHTFHSAHSQGDLQRTPITPPPPTPLPPGLHPPWCRSPQ